MHRRRNRLVIESRAIAETVFGPSAGNDLPALMMADPPGWKGVQFPNSDHGRLKIRGVRIRQNLVHFPFLERS